MKFEICNLHTYFHSLYLDEESEKLSLIEKLAKMSFKETEAESKVDPKTGALLEKRQTKTGGL